MCFSETATLKSALEKVERKVEDAIAAGDKTKAGEVLKAAQPEIMHTRASKQWVKPNL